MVKRKMKKPLEAKELSIIGIFAAVTAVLAQIAIPLPFTPMPISFGLVAVYITGMLLKPKHAVFAQVCYLALGAVGVPVFGNLRSGISALFGPTGGYLMVYPIMAGIVSMTLNSRFSRQMEYKQNKIWI
jgi:biotin transport system substrate-specific component